MTLPDLTQFTPQKLLQHYGSILDALRSLKVIRTSNNPVSDYTEWLVTKCLHLTLAGNSQKGFDATSHDGIKFEIKARRITPDNQSRQLSAIRDINGEHFDFLIAVVYDKDFHILTALQIPRAVVIAKARFVAATNSYKLEAKDILKSEPGVQDITSLLVF